MKHKVGITGIGLSTSIGLSVNETWDALLGCQVGIKKISRFDCNELRTKIAAFHPAHNGLNPRDVIEKILFSVTDEATSGFDLKHTPIDRYYYSLPNGIFDWDVRLSSQEMAKKHSGIYFEKYFLESKLAEKISDRFNVIDLPYLVSTACASSATALQMAYEAISSGKIDRAIVAGADCSVSNETISKFSKLSALSTRNDTPETASRPFCVDRDGFVIGEGGGALLLESEAAAKAGNREILSYISGVGSTTDNYHRTKGNPSGFAIKECMRKALDVSGLNQDHIDYVNAHGTSTPENDRIEAKCISEIFSKKIDVTSNKSMIGHTLNAAGIIEAAISVKSLCANVIPPTANYKSNDEFNVINVVDKKIEKSIKNILSNSFGFGGQNVSIVISK